MKICLVGVSCVGKTTIGKRLAERLGYDFFDLDTEIEDTFGTSIERLKAELLTASAFRQKAAQVLQHLVCQQDKPHCVVALPPSGLMDHYARVLKQGDCVTIALYDRPENIVARITFYDRDSHPIHKQLTEAETAYYLREITADMAYFGPWHRKAQWQVDIAGLGIEASVATIEALVRGHYADRLPPVQEEPDKERGV
jgi:shikimate kinase